MHCYIYKGHSQFFFNTEVRKYKNLLHSFILRVIGNFNSDVKNDIFFSDNPDIKCI